MTGVAAPLAEDGLVPYPAEFAERYRRAGLWGTRTIAQEFRATADAYPDRPAIVTPAGQLTYAELDRRTDRIALGLAELGLRPGERVLLQLTNHAGSVLAWYGLLKAGLVPVSTLVQYRRHELVDTARHTEPAAHLLEPDYAGHDLVQLAADVAAGQPTLRYLLTLGAGPTPPGAVAFSSVEARGPADPVAARDGVERIQRSIPADALAALQLSGGTTSTPKLIPRRHAEYWYNSRAYAEAIGLDAGDRVAHLLPVLHNAAIVCGLHAAHSAGAAFAVAPHDERQLLALARQGTVTHMMISPPMAKVVLASAELKAALGGLRVLTWVLGAMPAELIEAFETGSCRVTQMFGMAEGMCMFTPAAAPAQLRLSTVGTPISGLDEVRVYAPGTERLVEPGQPGELCCRGPYTIRGYYRAPERNLEAFTSDGFYRTGDIVVEVPGTGAGRYFALADRIKDLVNRGGEKINAAELEELLARHPAIERAAIVAMPDERLGERCCAFIVLTAGAAPLDVAALREYLSALGVAKFKYPERVEIRAELPMTSVTKLNKAALRAEIAQLLAAGR